MKTPAADIARLVEEFKIRFGVAPNALLVGDASSQILRLGTVHSLRVYEAPTLPRDVAVALVHPILPHE